MIPRLRAEESMAMSTVVAMGTGSLSKEDAREVSFQWRRAAGQVRPRSKGFDVAALMRMGLQVRRVPLQ